MGPLVPDIIGNELNLIVALLIGVAFGFILEQAGFSTSKKLVGLFYGYDFTVLRVFFTAGVTAMIGIVFLGHYGLLDINLIYINPTFIWSALIGGGVMGLGFVIGGFCPGTSIAAAAIGKIDAMIFILGSILGVMIFAEGYPLLEGLYKSGYWGTPRLFESLGVSQGVAAFGLIAMAAAAFWFTSLIENKVNGKSNPEFAPVRLYVVLTGIAFIFGFSAFFLPDIRDAYLHETSDNDYVSKYKVSDMTSDELAFRIIDDEKNLQIIDLRPAGEFKKSALPKSVLLSLNSLFDKDAAKIMGVNKMKTVFIAEDENTAKKGAIIADKLGFRNIYYLKGGFKEFRKDIIDFPKSNIIKTRQDVDTYRFRTKAAKLIPEMIEKSKATNTLIKKSKRVLGGC